MIEAMDCVWGWDLILAAIALLILIRAIYLKREGVILASGAYLVWMMLMMYTYWEFMK